MRTSIGFGLIAAVVAAPLCSARELVVDPGAAQGESHRFRSFAEGVAALRDGDRLRVVSGVYREAAVLRASRVSILAEHGARIEGAAAEGKAALVVKGDDTRIEGLECSNVAVPDRNGACVRLEGRNLTLSRVHFHDSEQGILTGASPGTVRIEHSLFERLGRDGQAHGIYVGGGRLEIVKSRVLSSKEEGHEVKSRARETVITDSVVASQQGDSSRAIDLPNGGIATIERSVVAHGPNAENRDLISFGVEGNLHPVNRLTIRDSVLVLERDRGNSVVNVRTPSGTVSLLRNLIVGRDAPAQLAECNRVVRARSDAGLKEALPDPLLENIAELVRRHTGALPSRCD